MSDYMMQKMAEVAPRHYAFLIKTSEEIKESPFQEETLSELDYLVKKAADPSMWAKFTSKNPKLIGALGAGAKGTLGIAGAAGSAAVGGIAMALAGDMYEAARRGITKGRNYKAMMAYNPQLQKMPAKEVQKAFSVLHHFNPEFSSDPTVAGAWVKSRVDLGSNEMYGDTTMLKSLVDSRKNIADTKKLSPFKLEREKKTPPGLSKNDFHEGLDDINSRLTNFEQNLSNQVFTNTYRNP